MALLLSMNQSLWVNNSPWMKTPEGWIIKQMEDHMSFSCHDNRRSRSPDLSNSKLTALPIHVIRVPGKKGQRRFPVCLSQFIEYFDLHGAAVDVRRKAYLHDFMMKIMEKRSLNITWTAHKQLFKVLETMFDEALKSELMVPEMRILLNETLETLREKSRNSSGSKAMWNKYIQTVTNMCTQIDQFKYTERRDDGELCLTDLPDECLLEILYRMPDHKNILHLGETCGYLNNLIKDLTVWEKLTRYHFSLQEILTFIRETGNLKKSSTWRTLYSKCYRKFGFKEDIHYADKPVICCGCKTLYWLKLGHDCLSTEESYHHMDHEPISPVEMVLMLEL